MTYREETLMVRDRHVRLLRSGHGQPLLYLHDTFIVGDVWLPLHQHLAAHYDVILPMHPGCIGSDAADIETMEELIFHYLDLCDILQLERPILLGTSLGGWIGAEWAVRYSGMLAGMILVDALGLRVPDAPAADVLRLDAAQMRSVLFATPTSSLAQQLMPDTPAPDVLPALLQARRTLARFAWQFPDNPKLARYLYRVQMPTLIIWGEHDGFVTSRHAQAYQAGIAGAELVLLPEAGHLPQAEQPEACARTIVDYLRRIGLAGG
jgi:pimeloyl-ACP methyl ester carboxylesterase